MLRNESTFLSRAVASVPLSFSHPLFFLCPVPCLRTWTLTPFLPHPQFPSPPPRMLHISDLPLFSPSSFCRHRKVFSDTLMLNNLASIVSSPLCSVSARSFFSLDITFLFQSENTAPPLVPSPAPAFHLFTPITPPCINFFLALNPPPPYRLVTARSFLFLLGSEIIWCINTFYGPVTVNTETDGTPRPVLRHADFCFLLITGPQIALLFDQPFSSFFSSALHLAILVCH